MLKKEFINYLPERKIPISIRPDNRKIHNVFSHAPARKKKNDTPLFSKGAYLMSLGNDDVINEKTESVEKQIENTEDISKKTGTKRKVRSIFKKFTR